MPDGMTHHATNIEPLPLQLARSVLLADQTELPLPFVIEIPLAEINVIDWLAAQSARPRFYWRGRDGDVEIGGVGIGYKPVLKDSSSMEAAERIIELLGDEELFFVGGRCFDMTRKRDEIWKSFPEEILYIPQHAIVKQNGQCHYRYCVTVNPGDRPEEKLAFINEEISKPEIDLRSRLAVKMLPAVTRTEYYPDWAEWQSQVSKTLKGIDSGNIEKLVLARRTDYYFDKPVDPFELLLRLETKHRHGFELLYQVESEEAFISVTPERLYRRDGRQLQMDALSSTMARGQTEAEDQELERVFIQSDKERQEHDYVIRGILQSVGSLCCQKPTAGDTSLLKLDRIQHLRTPLAAALKNDIGDSEVMESLHPTPAVGGVPKAAALTMMRQMESFDRGWYAAPVGCIGQSEAEFAVAIRSLLVRGKTVSVFTGAGVVHGSDAKKEWDELESKDILRPLLPGVMS